jgi:hypothetical protein
MSVALVNTDSCVVLGFTFPRKTTVSADGAVLKTASPAAAKVGQLTTRTDNNTGTLTMASGHGITTGARLDLYWDGGKRRGITVGTVSTNSVPFDLGSGDDLPANSTAITAMVPQSEAFVVTGDDVSALAVYSDQAGQFVFCEADNTEVEAIAAGGSAGGEQSYVWTADRNATNPLAGGAVTKVFFSHGSSSAAAVMRAVALIS